MPDELDEQQELVARELEAVASVLAAHGLQSYPLGRSVLGAGKVIALPAGGFTLVSVGLFRHEMAYLTGGVMRNLAQDQRLAILNTVNEWNQNNSLFPAYLHDAAAGWAVLIQCTLRASQFAIAPRFPIELVTLMPQVVVALWDKLVGRGVSGEPFAYTTADLDQLLLRSLA